MSQRDAVRFRASTAEVLARIAIGGAVLVLCWAARTVLITTLLAILIAFMLEPIAASLERLKIPSPIASLIAVLVLLGVIYGATSLAYRQGRDFVRDLPQYSGRIQAASDS